MSETGRDRLRDLLDAVLTEDNRSLTAMANDAGYESVEGFFSRAFSRAFGHPPSATTAGHWLPAPNGIHFHPPTSLWVRNQEQMMHPLTEQLVRHDLDDTRDLLDRATGLADDSFREHGAPGHTVLSWDDRLVDALCDPPESFVVSSVVAHVLEFSAHRRQLVRRMLRALGHETDHGDPITWLRRQRGEDAS